MISRPFCSHVDLFVGVGDLLIRTIHGAMADYRRHHHRFIVRARSTADSDGALPPVHLIIITNARLSTPVILMRSFKTPAMKNRAI
ncbi:hypothetical protein [Xanthomonas campestris]|uniref:hypothetical protein n=1 Tax=Xanthomonas campestris TaxID=339 RepID=UPI00388F8101